MNHFYYDTTHPLFFNYLEQVDKIKSIYNLVNMSDLNTKTQNVLSVIVLSLNKITSNNFIENLDDNVQLKLEDNQKSLEGLTFYYKLFRQIYNKNETNFEHQNRVDLISIPPTALISTLYSNIIEHNLSNPDKIMPVPLIFTAAYYISKKMDNINFELSEKEYNTCLKANEAYILMYKDDEIMTNQEHISKFFKQNLYCFNHQNNNFKNLSHSDYLQLIKINNNEKGFEDNHQISNLMKTITNQNSEIDLSSLNQSLNILSEMDENNKILKNEEISKFIENTKKTITSILDNYIICNDNISTGISNKNLLEEPIKLIYESISNTYNTLNEQNLSSFINHSKQQKKSP